MGAETASALTATVSVVVPVFNEEATLEELIRRCLAACTETDEPFELLLVDDGSSDRSAEMITSAAEEHAGNVVGVLLNRNYGQHAAVMAGLAQSRGEIVVTLDADLQNPPEEIRAAADDGHEVGLHAWDHHAWQMRLERMDAAAVGHELRRGFGALAFV